MGVLATISTCLRQTVGGGPGKDVAGEGQVRMWQGGMLQSGPLSPHLSTSFTRVYQRRRSSHCSRGATDTTAVYSCTVAGSSI